MLLYCLCGLMEVASAQCGYGAVIGTSKDYCIGSTLQVHANHSLARIVWYGNGQKVASAAASKYVDTNAITVAGGVGFGGRNDQLQPAGVAVDQAGNLYVSDVLNNRVMKWPPGATTGTCVAGRDDGTAGSAADQLSVPGTIFIDASGNLYVDDEGNRRVVEWTPGASSGTTVLNYGVPGAYYIQSNFYVDCSGNLYMVAMGGTAIMRFAPGADYRSGVVVAGGNGRGSASNQFTGVSWFWLDAQRNIFAVDVSTNRLIEWPAGAAQGTTLADVSAEVQGGEVSGGIFVDGSDTAYIAYYGKAPSWGGVVKVAPDGTSEHFLGGHGSGTGPDQFWGNAGPLTMDNRGNIFAADQEGYRVQEFRCTATSIDTVYTPTAPGTYWAVVTDLQGFSQSTDTVHIGEPNAGTPSILVTASTTSAAVCVPINFMAQVTNPGAAPTYQWMVSGVPAGGDSTSYSYDLFANGDQVYCILMTPAGCTGGLLADTSNRVTLGIDPQGAATVIIAASKTLVCAGEPVSFEATVQNGSATPLFNWMVNGITVPGDAGATYATDSLAGGSVVNCVITSDDVCGLAKSNSIPIEVDSRPAIVPGQVFYMTYGKGVQLDPQITGNPTSWLWSPGTGLADSTIADPLAAPSVNTVYTLMVSTPAGCSDTGKISVEVYTPLQMPNAFTPNGDGHNDVLYVLGGPENSVVEKFVVFDRWGREVFRVKDAAPGAVGQGWDGRVGSKDAPAGAYVYVVVMRYAGGSRQIYKGVVELIR